MKTKLYFLFALILSFIIPVKSAFAYADPAFSDIFTINALNGAALKAGATSLNTRLGDLRRTQGSITSAIWARGFYNEFSKYNNTDLNALIAGGEAGIDFLLSSNPSSRTYFGIMAGYLSADNSKGSDKLKASAPVVGLYGTWITNSGWFADIAARYFFYQTQITQTGEKTDWKLFAATLEAGKEFKIYAGECSFFMIEPKIKGTYGNTIGGRVGSLSFPSENTMIARPALFAGFSQMFNSGARIEPYLEGGYSYDFSGDIKYRNITTGDIYKRDVSGSSFDIGGGINFIVTNIISVYTYAGFEQGDKIKNISANAGIRIALSGAKRGVICCRCDNKTGQNIPPAECAACAASVVCTTCTVPAAISCTTCTAAAGMQEGVKNDAALALVANQANQINQLNQPAVPENISGAGKNISTLVSTTAAANVTDVTETAVSVPSKVSQEKQNIAGAVAVSTKNIVDAGKIETTALQTQVNQATKTAANVAGAVAVSTKNIVDAGKIETAALPAQAGQATNQAAKNIGAAVNAGNVVMPSQQISASNVSTPQLGVSVSTTAGITANNLVDPEIAKIANNITDTSNLKLVGDINNAANIAGLNVSTRAAADAGNLDNAGATGNAVLPSAKISTANVAMAQLQGTVPGAAGAAAANNIISPDISQIAGNIIGTNNFINNANNAVNMAGANVAVSTTVAAQNVIAVKSGNVNVAAPSANAVSPAVTAVSKQQVSQAQTAQAQATQAMTTGGLSYANDLDRLMSNVNNNISGVTISPSVAGKINNVPGAINANINNNIVQANQLIGSVAVSSAVKANNVPAVAGGGVAVSGVVSNAGAVKTNNIPSVTGAVPVTGAGQTGANVNNVSGTAMANNLPAVTAVVPGTAVEQAIANVNNISGAAGLPINSIDIANIINSGNNISAAGKANTNAIKMANLISVSDTASAEAGNIANIAGSDSNGIINNTNSANSLNNIAAAAASSANVLTIANNALAAGAINNAVNANNAADLNNVSKNINDSTTVAGIANNIINTGLTAIAGKTYNAAVNNISGISGTQATAAGTDNVENKNISGANNVNNMPAAANAKAAAADQSSLARADLGSGYIPTVFFEFDSYKISPKDEAYIKLLADKIMSSNENRRYQIEGFTDRSGTAAYNKALSLRRARAVYDQLIKSGVPADRLQYRGFGFTRPLDKSKTEEGDAKNRRVEIHTIL